MKSSSAQSILAIVLGGAAIVAGHGEEGSAIIQGGQEISRRNFLQYSRTQEGAADAAAMRYLDATHQSARGMLEFFEILGDQELLSQDRQDPYYRSHPLTRQRVNAVEEFISRSEYSNQAQPAAFIARHRRMKAKLHAFLEAPTYTFRRYKEDDSSIEARYARAIAYYRRADLDRALPLVDGLITSLPNDPYFHELKGQILFENGRNREALPPYMKAVELEPTSSLLRRDLARVQIEANDPAMLEGAIENLLMSIDVDRTDSLSWRQLAIAYGRLGKTAESSLALAEEALLQNDVKNAIYHGGRAEKMLPEGSRGWLHAQDILNTARNKKEK